MAYSFGKALARKSPPPMAAMGMDDEERVQREAEEPDEDADAAVEASAFEDFARAAGFKASPAAYAAFKEAVRACVKGVKSGSDV